MDKTVKKPKHRTKIGQFVLENIFLTKANTVGMQWLKDSGEGFTIYTDKKGELKITSSCIVPVPVFEKALDYYEKRYDHFLQRVTPVVAH